MNYARKKCPELRFKWGQVYLIHCSQWVSGTKIYLQITVEIKERHEG